MILVGLFQKASAFFANIFSVVKFGIQKCIPIVSKVFPILFLLAIFCLPMSIHTINLYEAEEAVRSIMPFSLPLTEELYGNNQFIRCFFFLIYLIPFSALFTLISFFIKENLNKAIYILVFISLSIYISCSLICLILCANCLNWFLSISWYTYASFFCSVLAHIVMSLFSLNYFRMKKPEYKDYKAIKQGEKRKGFSIKNKFFASVIGTLVVVLVALIVLILNGYKKMITEAVSDVGRTQAEQTAAVYESAEGKYEKIINFFETQKKTNSLAASPYERIDIIISSKNEQIYLENIDANTKLPNFDVFAYTTGRASKISDSEKTITKEQAHDYIRRYQNGSFRKEPVYDKASRSCKYIYPVTLSRKAGLKLVGFSVVTYRQEVLMKQYFQTKIFVFTFSLIFLYLSILLVIFIADVIVDPLIYLRTNVRKTSAGISEMLSGSAKIVPEEIKYYDSIKTSDEIKDLSVEIDNMFSLIKGIVPYISFSTLQHAEKDSKRSTISRDLCFLFTDIRGFTSLCEGMPPKKVVDILNHYLDIETEIILNNGGDIDKFVGDEMMAFFSGPKKEFNACKAAMEIRQAMREQQELASEDGSTFVSIGIGINTGKVVFGSVGSRTRKDFTSIGDTVNLAARLESANKVYGSKSIITEAVYSKLKDSFICRELDFMTVKGKTEPVRIYEILQAANKGSEKLEDIKKLFEKGLELYRQQDWDESEKYFRICAQKYNDMPSIVFIDRIIHFKNNPPAKDWDGVFKMEMK